MVIGTGFLRRLSSGPTMWALAVSSTKVSFDSLPAAFLERLVGGVFGEVLVRAIGPEHVGRAHAADATVVAVVRRAGRIVGRKIIERRGNSRGVEIIPERGPLAPEQGLGRLVIERPEVELKPVVAHVPEPLAGHGLGGRVEGIALLLRMPVDEVEDPVRAGPCAVDEVGPGDGALRRRAGAQTAETTAGPELFQVGEQTGLHHAFRQARVHPVHADDDHLLAEAPRDVAAAAQPVVPHAQSGGADRPGSGHGGRAFEQSPAVHLGDGCISHYTTCARVSSFSLGAFSPASATVRTLPSM